jgi:hypothetical protein
MNYPEWSRDGKLGIDLLFDDNSYDEMRNALKERVNTYRKKRRGPINPNSYRGEQTRFSINIPSLSYSFLE